METTKEVNKTTEEKNAKTCIKCKHYGKPCKKTGKYTPRKTTKECFAS